MHLILRQTWFHNLKSMLLNFDSSQDQVAKESIHVIKMKTDEGKGEKH